MTFLLWIKLLLTLTRKCKVHFALTTANYTAKDYTENPEVNPKAAERMAVEINRPLNAIEKRMETEMTLADALLTR